MTELEKIRYDILELNAKVTEMWERATTLFPSLRDELRTSLLEGELSDGQDLGRQGVQSPLEEHVAELKAIDSLSAGNPVLGGIDLQTDLEDAAGSTSTPSPSPEDLGNEPDPDRESGDRPSPR